MTSKPLIVTYAVFSVLKPRTGRIRRLRKGLCRVYSATAAARRYGCWDLRGCGGAHRRATPAGRGPLSLAVSMRVHPRRHRRGAKTRPTTGSTTTRSGDRFRCAETHRSRSVARSSRQTAQNRQGNGLQNRRRDARRGCRALNVILGTNLPMTPTPSGELRSEPEYRRAASRSLCSRKPPSGMVTRYRHPSEAARITVT